MEKLIGHLPGPKPNPLFGNFFELVKKKAYAKAFDQFIPQYGDIVSLNVNLLTIAIRNLTNFSLRFMDLLLKLCSATPSTLKLCTNLPTSAELTWSSQSSKQPEVRNDVKLYLVNLLLINL